MFKGQVKRTENWATVRKPKDRRNGQFSGVERCFLNPAPSFLLLFCGKKVEKKNSCLSFVLIQKKQKIKAWIYPCFGNL